MIDLEGLPPELVKELSKRNQGLTLDCLVLSALARLDGTACVNELLISIYRAENRICRRAAVQGALGKLKKAGQVCKTRIGLWQLVPNGRPTR